MAVINSACWSCSLCGPSSTVEIVSGYLTEAAIGCEEVCSTHSGAVYGSLKLCVWWSATDTGGGSIEPTTG